MFFHKKILFRLLDIEPVQRQSLISLFWQITFTGVGFLSTMYFAHSVGASVLGAYYLFMSYYGFFNLFVDGGLGNAAVKRISEGREQNEYFSAYFVLRFTFGMIVVLFLLVFKDLFVDIGDSGLLTWLMLALIASIFCGAISSGNMGKGRMGMYSTSAALGNISRILFQVVAVYLGYNAAGLAGGLVFGMLVGAIIEFHYFDMNLQHFDRNHIRSLFTFSFWIFLTSSGSLVFSQADTLMIGYFMESSDVGIYRVALQFTTIATFATFALRSTLYPKVSRWNKEGNSLLVEMSLSKALSYSFLLAIPVLVGGILLGDKLLYFFYGSEFSKGYSVLVVMLCVQLMNVFQFLFTMYLNAHDIPAESFKGTAIAVVLNIVLNILFIPIMGIVGAAIATLLSISINVLFAQRTLSKRMVIKIESYSLLNILKAAITMGIFIFSFRIFIPLNVYLILLDVFIGCLLYTILVLKLDQNIYVEVREIVQNLGLGFVWPKWL